MPFPFIILKFMDEYKKVEEWYSENADNYAKKAAVLLRKQLKYFISLLPKNGMILDVGCGPGHDTEYFAKEGFEAIGIDFSPGMIAYAKKNRTAGVFKKMNMLEIDNFYAKNYFDGIWSSSSITHLKKADIPRALNQIKKVILPGCPIGIILKKRMCRKEKIRKIIFNEFYKKEILEYAKKSELQLVKIDEFEALGISWFFVHLMKKM